MNLDNNAYTFLKEQRLLVLATAGPEPWVANVYYTVGEDGKLYFVSGEDTRHSTFLKNDSKIAFSVVWYDQHDYTNRKAVQGAGRCVLATEVEDIQRGVQLHNEHFPQFAERLTEEYLLSDDNDAGIWIIEPTYMKYWDDELYGLNGTQEFGTE